MNLVMIGLDGRPRQKDLKSILSEWLDFRMATLTRRLAHDVLQDYLSGLLIGFEVVSGLARSPGTPLLVGYVVVAPGAAFDLHAARSRLAESLPAALVPRLVVVDDSIVDGDGCRLTVFVQGCHRRCRGCQNPETQPMEGGRRIDTADILAKVKANPLLAGVTFSGGEPFLQPAPLAALARADVVLDTFPYPGGAMTATALASRFMM